MIACSSCNNPPRSERGFSLIELAIAVFIMALLIGSILVPLQSQIESRKIDETQRMLDQARELLLGYAAANGYLPCPASTTSNGQELGNHTTGVCDATVTGTNAYVGFLPAVTLGYTPIDGSGYALDAWGLAQNRIRYAVTNVDIATSTPCPTAVTKPFTKANGMRTATMSCIQSLSTLLYVCNTGTGVSGTGCSAATAELSDNAIAVVWSLGSNAPNGGNAPHEDKNLDNNRVFVLAPYSRVSGSEFDDQLVWIGPPILFSRLLSSGALP
ncbi:MAG TPA: prepilin-type N-terminal cleavage/methylation domain-containing protein [Burkholderiales bacterium]|nr:prepilin-type N-terminal cleavage/methylation domain-containing protein [Burkholderiales bacterium]